MPHFASTSDPASATAASPTRGGAPSPRRRARALAAVTGDGLMRAGFADERAATAYLERTPSVLRELLDDAGLEEAADTPNRERVTHADLECRLPNGDVVMVELALALDRDHVWKDFRYIVDRRLGARLAGFVWLCDEASQSALDGVLEYADLLQVKHRIPLVVLRLKRLRVADGHARFDRLLYLPGRGAEPPVLRVAGGMADQVARAAKNGCVDSLSLATCLGVSPSWVAGCLPKSKECGRPALDYERTASGTPAVGPSRRRLFALPAAMRWVGEVESFVRRQEGLAQPAPFVSAKDPRIGPTWLKLIDALTFDGRTRSTASLKRQLRPVGFCIASSDRGYTLLYERTAVEALSLPAAARNR